MAGFGDTIRNAIQNATGASSVTKALAGHTTSGLDAAMQQHADQVHPVKPLQKRADGTPIYPLDQDYKP
jgi:hypothetical protein